MAKRNPRWARLIPQPRWLRRWYYRKSFDWWGHPSNGHWKQFGLSERKPLLPGERDIDSGGYNAGQTERPTPTGSRGGPDG